jgi:hypothetical protein
MRTRFFLVGPACAALLIAGGLTVAAAPVFAAVPRPVPVDLAVRLSGTTLTNQVQQKVATATVTNQGATTARGVRLRFAGRVDSEVVNPSSVAFCPPSTTSPSPGAPTSAPSLEVEVGGECGLGDLAPGQSLRLTSTIVRSAHGTGPVGEVTVGISHAGPDPVPANNSATATIAFADGPAPDLYARAWDGPVDRTGELTPAVPGTSADLRFEIGNQGAEPVSGMVITVALPAHVTFAETRQECAYDADRQTATCTYPELSLIAAQADSNPYDRNYSALRFRYLLRVARSAPAPARLAGGQLSVVPLLAGQLPATVVLPDDVTGLVAADADGTDDTDRFTVSTVTDTGEAGGLPLTGPPTALLGGLGLAVLATGGGLLLLARQRRTGPARPPSSRPRPAHRC